MSSLSYQKSSNEYVAINMLQPKGNIDIFCIGPNLSPTNDQRIGYCPDHINQCDPDLACSALKPELSSGAAIFGCCDKTISDLSIPYDLINNNSYCVTVPDGGICVDGSLPNCGNNPLIEGCYGYNDRISPSAAACLT